MKKILDFLFRVFSCPFVAKSSNFKVILLDNSYHIIPDQNQLELSFTPPFIQPNLKIANTRLRLSLYHEWLPDLNIRIFHKNRFIPLLTNPFPPYEDCCGSFNDWLQTSAFNGMDVYGEWLVIIQDTEPGDTGEFYCAELELTVSSDCKDQVFILPVDQKSMPRAGKKKNP